METLVVALEYSNIFEAITADTAESTELQSRSDLILAIRDVVHAKKWDLMQAAAAMCITQVTVTDLVNGRIEKFSINQLKTYIEKGDSLLVDFAAEIEKSIEQGYTFSEKYINTVHHEASKSVQLLSRGILGTYPSLGILASTENHVLNHVFRDYFTATQHHIFRKGTTESRIFKDLE